MCINEELDKLFDDWEMNQHHDKFVRDGIFNNTPDACDRWSRSPRKIAFLLKDNPHGKGDTRGWIDPTCLTDERVRDNVRKNLELKNLFVRNLAYAFYAMSFDEFDFDRIRFEDVKAHALQAPWALVECKKQAGGPTIEPCVLAEHIKTDHQYLLDEFSILKPNIYICCTGTMDIVREKYKDGLVIDIEGVESKYNIAYHPETNTLILMCYHPSHPRCRRSPRNYVNDIMKHYGQFLKTSYGQEFLNKLQLSTND